MRVWRRYLEKNKHAIKFSKTKTTYQTTNNLKQGLFACFFATFLNFNRFIYKQQISSKNKRESIRKKWLSIYIHSQNPKLTCFKLFSGKIFYMKTKAELTFEIEQLKSTLWEREREKRTVNRSFLMLNSLLTSVNLHMC